jgi:hypothetical protein
MERYMYLYLNWRLVLAAMRMYVEASPDSALCSSHQEGDGVTNGSIFNYPEVGGVLKVLRLCMEITILLE